jgi:hypothetical protein
MYHLSVGVKLLRNLCFDETQPSLSSGILASVAVNDAAMSDWMKPTKLYKGDQS